MIGKRSSVALLGLLVGLGGCSGGAAPDGDNCGGPCADGHFETRTFSAPASTGNWYAADLDLDRRDELVLTQAPTRTRVFAFDAERGLTQTATLPAATWLSVGDITADGRPDVWLGGVSLQGFRSLDAKTFSPLRGTSRPVSGESAGRVSVTNFPLIARWRERGVSEPLAIKDVYDLGERSPTSTQIESFSAVAQNVTSQGNTTLAVPLLLSKRFVAVDLDGDGIDELWGIDAWGKLAQLSPAQDAPGSAWHVQNTWSVGDPGQLGSGDASGDGMTDLVGRGGGLVVTGGGPGGPGRVHELSLPKTAHDCVWLQLDRDPERELVCRASAEGDEGELSAYDVSFETDQLTPHPGLELRAKGRLIVGDFDGDGLEDLAAVGDELVIALNVPVP